MGILFVTGILAVGVLVESIMLGCFFYG